MCPFHSDDNGSFDPQILLPVTVVHGWVVSNQKILTKNTS